MADPYKTKKAHYIVYTHKKTVRARVVAVLKGSIEGRGIELIYPASRAVRKGEIFEMICTPDLDAGPGKRIDSVTYLGFLEVEDAGVLLVEDIVKMGGKPIGVIIGFDETHFPNHQNVVLKPIKGIDIKKIELPLDSILEFVMPGMK